MNDALETAHRAAANDDTSQSVVSPRQAKKRRRIATWKERFAAACIELGKVPEPLRSHGTVDEICNYIQADHNFPHALGGDTRPQNLNLLAKPLHAEKTRKDIAAIAKSKRLAAGVKETLRKIFAKDHGLQINVPRLTRKGNPPLPCGRHSGWKKPLRSWAAVRRDQ